MEFVMRLSTSTPLFATLALLAGASIAIAAGGGGGGGGGAGGAGGAGGGAAGSAGTRRTITNVKTSSPNSAGITSRTLRSRKPSIAHLPRTMWAIGAAGYGGAKRLSP